MSARRRRPRSLLGTIIVDPYRKLAAIALAIGLWHFLDNQLMDDQAITVSLRTDGIAASGEHFLDVHFKDPDYTGNHFEVNGEPIQSVELMLHGPKAQLADKTRGKGLEFAVSFELQGWSKDREAVDFTELNLVPPSVLQDFDIKMKPARVQLVLDKKGELLVPVRLDDIVRTSDDPQLQDMLDLESAEFTVSEARVTGSATAIRRLEDRLASGTKPFRVHLADAGGVASGRVEFGIPELDLHMESFRIDIPIRQTVFTFNARLRVVVDDGGLPPENRGYVPDKEIVDAKIEVTGELRRVLSLKTNDDLQEWARKYLSLHVFVDPGSNPNAAPLESDIVTAAILALRGPESAFQADCRLAPDIPITIHRKE